MKKTPLYLFGLLLPILTQATTSADYLHNLDHLRLKTSLCQVDDRLNQGLEKTLNKVMKRGLKGELISSLVRSDLSSLGEFCTGEIFSQKEQTLLELKNAEEGFPLEILDEYVDSESEFQRDALAENFLKERQSGDCEELSIDKIYDNKSWHELLIKNGWTCVADNFTTLSQTLNEKMNFSDSQSRLFELQKLSLTDLKVLFKKMFSEGKSKKLKLAFVPQLSYENGDLNKTFPYNLFTKPTELTSYNFLKREFKKLGVEVSVIQRNSLSSLEDQVKETREAILKLEGEHVVISRSMGSRVVREIVADNNSEINNKIKSWLNVGGTPHGSVIARYKAFPDVFYKNVIPSLSGALKLPVRLISKDPRIASHLEDTLLSAMVRSNLMSMAPVEARQLSESQIPVLNAIFIRNDFQRATSQVDPVWLHMLQYGPTEGSALLSGAAVDTSQSMRLILDSDHLAFWKYSKEEALAVYLRLLIISQESGLN